MAKVPLPPLSGAGKPLQGRCLSSPRPLVCPGLSVAGSQGYRKLFFFPPRGLGVGLMLLRELCRSILAGRWAFGGDRFTILQNLFVAPLRLVFVSIIFIMLM